MSPKKKALTLTIPEPCGEDFNAMTPVKGGKFCGSCEKTIVDFRTMNDYQILDFYQQNNGKICGVFNQVQLNRAMSFPMEAKPTRNWKAVAALAAGLMFGSGLVAQTTAPTLGKIAMTKQAVSKGTQTTDSTIPNRVVKGIVKDQEYQETLIGANIIIEGTNLATNTDFDGFFEITVPSDLDTIELTISYTGFETQTILFNPQYPIPKRTIEVNLESNAPMMGDVIVMGIMVMPDLEETPTCGTEEVVKIEEVPEITPDAVTEKGIITDQQMTVYPNPFINSLKVSYDFANTGDYLFNVYDTNGRLLFAKPYHLLKGQQTIELEMATKNLTDGVYILQLSDSRDRILATKKVYKGQP